MAWTNGSFLVSLLPSSIQQETLSNSCCPPFCTCFLTPRHNWSCSCLLVGLFSFFFHSTPEWSWKKIHQNLRSLRILRPSGVRIQSQTPHETHTPWIICFFPNSSPHSPRTPLINWRSANTPDLVLPVNISCNALPIFSCPIPSQHLASTSLQKDLPQYKCYLLALLSFPTQSLSLPVIFRVPLSVWSLSLACYVHLYAGCLGKQLTRNDCWVNVWPIGGSRDFRAVGFKALCEEGDLVLNPGRLRGHS